MPWLQKPLNTGWHCSDSGERYLYLEGDEKEKIPYCVINSRAQEFSLSCVVCGKIYKSSSGARAHYKIKHCGTFDHYCEICNKGFQQQSHLKCHMALHYQEKQYECDICGLKYAHKTSMTAHMRVAHGTLSQGSTIPGQGDFDNVDPSGSLEQFQKREIFGYNEWTVIIEKCVCYIIKLQNLITLWWWNKKVLV